MSRHLPWMVSDPPDVSVNDWASPPLQSYTWILVVFTMLSPATSMHLPVIPLLGSGPVGGAAGQHRRRVHPAGAGRRGGVDRPHATVVVGDLGQRAGLRVVGDSGVLVTGGLGDRDDRAGGGVSGLIHRGDGVRRQVLVE